MTQTKLAGKTALVTGAAKRIGREIATALAAEGANVIVHYRSSEAEALDLCEKLKGRGVNSWPLMADLADPEACESLIGRAIETAGSLDILVNSAAIYLPGTIGDMNLSSLMQHMQVNAWAPFVLCRDFARLAGRGKIINMLDTRLASFDFKHVAYILSKQALSMLTRMMALEYAPNITVNGIAPGLILPPPGSDHSYLDRLVDTVPLRRHGDPSDIALAALYLLKSDFVTGEVLSVDGGRHLKGTNYGPDNR
ncbi:MAG: SDR family oxidoreductase [bacterium]